MTETPRDTKELDEMRARELFSLTAFSGPVEDDRKIRRSVMWDCLRDEYPVDCPMQGKNYFRAVARAIRLTDEAAGIVSVPKEATEEMAQVIADKNDMRVNAYPPQYEDGTLIDIGMSQEEANGFNADFLVGITKDYKTFISASPFRNRP